MVNTLCLDDHVSCLDDHESRPEDHVPQRDDHCVEEQDGMSQSDDQLGTTKLVIWVRLGYAWGISPGFKPIRASGKTCKLLLDVVY